MTFDCKFSGKYTHYFFFRGFVILFFVSGNTNTVLKYPSKATAALNGFPALLLNPLITPVCPLVSSSVISASVSVFPAFYRKTGSPQSGLPQRTTLP